MRVASSAILLFAMAAVLPAQQARITVVASPSHRLTVCPASLTAQQQSSGQTIWTIAQEDKNNPRAVSNGAGTGVHVDLHSLRSAVRHIELSVDYLPPGTRVLLISESNADRASELSKTFDLATTEPAQNIEGDLLVGPAFSITRVNLLSATYADGTTWKAGSDNPCSVEPNRFLPIGRR